MASGVDRISTLPEDVLHHVLRYLPAQEVVRSCVLARGWRGVWRSVPALRFTGFKGWESADRFVQFVDHLLRLWCAVGLDAPLNSCEFDFDSDGFMALPGSEQHASRWICEAASRVRALRIRIVEEQEPSPLSDVLHLVSRHITRLELIGVGLNDGVADFSGCPALVQLDMKDCDIFVKQILSPSLKHLRIARCYISEYYRILISVPSLVSLELIECHRGRVPLLGSMPWLERAIVVLNEECSDQCAQDKFDGCGAETESECDGCYYYYGDPEYPASGPFCDRKNSIFLKGLSEATHLELSADYDVMVFNRDLRWCPTFTNLKTLVLNDWCLAAHHNALICFLQHSPILENLTIQLSKVPPSVIETEGIYNPLGQSVASDRLKMVEVRCANVDKRVHKILNILTIYGIRLEQINIQHTSRIPGSGCFNFVCTGFS